MATFYKRRGGKGVRWTVRVRIRGREVTDTFSTRAAAVTWARARERAIETGEFVAPEPGKGPIFADAVDAFLIHRKRLKRAPGATFANGLARLKDWHGLEPLSALSVAFWRRHSHDRLSGECRDRDGDKMEPATGSTIASELAYAGSVLRHAAREGHQVDAAAPGIARTLLREDGVQVVSRQRTRRLTDDELDKLFAWIDANAKRTALPLRDLVDFALSTGMRRGEILALERTDIVGRVATIKRKHPVERDRREGVPLLKPHASWPKVDPLAIIERQPKIGARVFPYVGDTVSFWFERAVAGAELRNVVFHTLRHECLSRLAERGFDPLRLALIGGHRDLRNVKRYAKLDAERLANE